MRLLEVREELDAVQESKDLVVIENSVLRRQVGRQEKLVADLREGRVHEV